MLDIRQCMYLSAHTKNKANTCSNCSKINPLLEEKKGTQTEPLLSSLSFHI